MPKEKLKISPREFSPIREKMEKLDWENAKEQAINDINAAKVTIEISNHMIELADKRVGELKEAKE